MWWLETCHLPSWLMLAYRDCWSLQAPLLLTYDMDKNCCSVIEYCSVKKGMIIRFPCFNRRPCTVDWWLIYCVIGAKNVLIELNRVWVTQCKIMNGLTLLCEYNNNILATVIFLCNFHTSHPHYMYGNTDMTLN